MATGGTQEARGRLQGANAIVFVGTYGIGAGIVKVFQREGAKVVMTGRNKEKGAEAEKNIHGATFIQANITNYQDCERVAKETTDRFGMINIVVYNAGIYPPAMLENITEEYISSLIDMNLKGSIYATKACLPYLRDSAKSTGRARVILISSITGECTGCPGQSVYGSTKAGQVGFVRSAAVELAKEQITVNAVLPGNTATESMMTLFEDTEAEDTIADVVSAIPMGRLGTPEDIGNAVAFLASPQADYITGQTVVVDGGQTVPEN